ncbi:tRNA (adenosine(37)-N6)-threonylcarbamoyltransferase complex dimerization subunit type 1 TsaB [Gymnodinialimonas ulvae]|uniref:tRNA (adenosine(37)-N6)-threonylcarbamoyltransferase complex dimerization subunit type 1 TsaB n=1 Tax=Gymnodinialimonas ulvae TaxID=3126504 RepID=UPI0030A0F7D0
MILAFDTSGPWVRTALLRGDDLLTGRDIAMAKGQVEHLMPLIEDTLAEARAKLTDLVAIGVGTGPGNFTGIRISVSAGRGLALALGIPAIGVTSFDALYGNRMTTLSALVALPAPKDTFYIQRLGPKASAPLMIREAEAAALVPSGPVDLLVTPAGNDIPDWLRALGRNWSVAPPMAPAIARITATRMGQPHPRPAPLYIKPADAAPSREAGPTML